MNFINNIVSRIHSKFIEYTALRPLLNSVEENSYILEIGGGYNPRFKKDRYCNAYHLDHCDTSSLRAKYVKDGTVSHLVDQIQYVDFVYNGSPIETIIPPPLRFDYIYSSHAIEHQVDLVGHLRSLEHLLAPQGRIILVIPDLRACFDRFRFPTVTSDALAVYLRNQKIHQGKQVFEALAQSISLNPGRTIRQRELIRTTFSHPLQTAYDAMCRAERDDAAFSDFHAWTFTPSSFRLMILELFLLHLLRLKPLLITASYGNQFCVVLEMIDPKEMNSLIDKYDKQRLKLCRKLYVKL